MRSRFNTIFTELLVLGLLVLSGNFEKRFSQSQLDSLETLDPFTHGKAIRKIIDSNFSVLGKTNEANLSRYNSLIVQANKNGNYTETNKLICKIGDIYFTSGIYNTSIQYYADALKYFEAHNDSLNVALTKAKLGRSYYYAGIDYWADYYKSAAEILRKLKIKKYSGYEIYLKAILEPDEFKSDVLFKKALELQMVLLKEFPDDIIVKEHYLAFLNANGEDKTALKIAQELGNIWSTIIILNNYGFRKNKEGKYDEAIESFSKSLRICKQERFKTLLRNIYEDLSDSYRLKGDWKKSSNFLQLVIHVEGSLFNEKIARNLAEWKIKYEAEKKEIDNAYLNKEKSILDEKISISRNLNIALIFLVGVTLSVFFIVFLSKHKLKKAYTLLDAKNNENLIQKTELLKLNEMLRESEKNLKEAQAIAHLANWELILEKNELHFSEQLPIIIPSSADTNKNDLESIISLVVDDDKTLVRNFFLSDFIQDVEFRICVNSTTKWIKAQKEVSVNEQNKSMRIFGTVQDITDLKEKEKIKIEMATQRSFTQQLIQSQEEERKRIASELHDSLGQDILIIKNRVLLGLQNQEIDQYSHQQLEEINNSVSSVLGQVREISFNLRPAHLERLGLTETIISAIRNFEQASSIETGIEINNIDGLLSSEQEINLFRIVQEGLNNILKHANAKKTSVSILRSFKSITLTICDNGQGFDYSTSKEKSLGFGLKNICNRAMLLNGKFEIKSKHLEGTCLEISIPV